MRVALDIETTGLQLTDKVTCVALCSEDDAWSWVLCECTLCTKDNIASSIQQILDDADTIYAFNGASFDIPFMARYFGYTDAQVGRWMLKLVDPLYAARALLGYDACVKLDAVLKLNGLPAKISSGGNAITMFNNKQWKELEAYCVDDARLTFALLSRDIVLWSQQLYFDPKHVGMWKYLQTNR